MSAPVYSGYSSVVNNKVETKLYDIDLVKQDLMNHFHTRIGERVGRPNWGSIIWDLLFDVADSRIEALVVQDAQRIIGEDPRVKLLELLPFINLDTHSIDLKIRLQLVETNMDTVFTVSFQN